MVKAMKAEHDLKYEPDARFTHALYLLKLEKGGVHFLLNDLSEDEWFWLAELKAALHKNEIKKATHR